MVHFIELTQICNDPYGQWQKAQKAMQETGIWEDIMSKPSKFE